MIERGGAGICVLKHKESGKYLKGATGNINLNDRSISGVQLYLTKDIESARLIENPDFTSCAGYGVEAIPVKVKNKIEIIESGRIL